MADTNFKGAFWGSEVRKRQARSYWPTEADNTDGVDMSSANTVLLLNGEGTNGAQNNTFLDSSTNSFTITRNGDATQGSLSPFSPTGWSAYFDGTGDYLSATIPSIALGTSAFTIEAWVWVPSSGAGVFSCPISSIATNADGANERGVFISINNSYLKARFGRSVNGEFDDIEASTNPVSANQWNHIALVRENTSTNGVKLYLNGTRVVQGTSAISLNKQQMVIGRSAPSFNGEYYTGYISNARWVNSAVYTGNFTPPRLLPLTPYGSNVQYPATANVSSSFTAGNVSFLSLRGPQFVDDSPSRLPITIAGDSKIVPFSPYRNYLDIPRSYSSYFDGTGDNVTFPTLTLSATAWTIEGWVYLTSSTITQGLINFIPHNTLAISLNRTNALETYVYIGNGSTWVGSPAINSSVNFNRSAWNHIALVRNSGIITLYHNGVAVGTTSTMPSGLTGGGTIGSLYIPTAPYMAELLTGYISDFRIVNNTAVYTGNFTPPSSPLLTSGNSIMYASVANVNTTFASANTSLLTLQDANIFDRSNNAFAITVSGNVQPTIQNPFGETITSNVVYDATVYDGSGYFNGTTSTRLTLASNTAFAFGTGAYTIQAWVYLTAYGSPATNLIDCGGATNSIGLSILSSGGLFINKYGTGSVFSTSSSVPLNSWTHVAASRVSTGSNDTRLFINGVLAATGTDNNDWTVTTTPSIGGINFSGYTVSGYLSDVRIAKGTALYTSSFVPPNSPSSAVANTSLLLKFQNAGVVDRTGKADIITLGNGQISTSVYKYGSGSIYFDGNGDGLFLPSSPNYSFGSGDFTIEFWIYFNSTASGQNIIHGYTSGSTFDYTIYTSTNTLVYYISSDGSTWNVANGVNIGSISTSTWYHVALVRSGSTIKPYLNGVAGTATTSSAIIFNSAPPLYLGSNNGEYFNGYLDDVRITKGQARYDVSQSTITIPRKTFNLL